MNVKICIAGKIACGKSTVAEIIARYTGFPRISFGNILRKYSESQNLHQTREGLQNLGQKILDRYGYGGFLKWAMEHSSDVNWTESLVIDGVRHVAIYQRITEIFPKTILVYCDCDTQTQINRILTRDKITKKEAIKVISHPTEKYVQNLKPYADIIYRLGSSVPDLISQLDKLMLI